MSSTGEVAMEKAVRDVVPQQSVNGSPGAILEELVTHYAITELYVFGSRAREILAKVCGLPIASVFPHSDVDIGVMPSPGKRLTVMEKVELAIALEDLLEVERVDLVIISEAEPFLAAEIVRGELLYCEDPDQQAENELFLLARAGDLAHYQRERIENILLGVCR